MKGLSGRIVLAAIILSCGMVMQMGSGGGQAAGEEGASRPARHKVVKTRAAWLPSAKLLKHMATSTYRNPMNQ